MSLQAFLHEPSLNRLLCWCDEHCASVSDGRVDCFEMRERADFWAAVRQVANSFSDATTAVIYDVAVFYPGRDPQGKVLHENNFARLLHNEFVHRRKTVYYADLDRIGRFDLNIGEAVVHCRKAVFVVSRAWFERKWCLAEMLLAMASTDDMGIYKCKVIRYGEQFDEALLPLHTSVVRVAYNLNDYVTVEVKRLTDWVLDVPDTASSFNHRPVRAVVLSTAIDADAYAMDIAPTQQEIVPATNVFDLNIRMLADASQADAPVLVVVKLPANVDDGAPALRNVKALFLSLRQPPTQTVPAALFDASPSDRLLLSRADVADNAFRPRTSPVAQLVDESQDGLHRIANSITVHSERLSIAYVPDGARSTMLTTVSEQWIAHTVDRRAFRFAFLKLHNANGDAVSDRIGDWRVFDAVFAASVPAASSEHFLVLLSHVGALVSCLVSGGAWVGYLAWLAAQDGEVSVAGLAPRRIDKEAVARLARLGSDKVECFESERDIESRVGASVWTDARSTSLRLSSPNRRAAMVCLARWPPFARVTSSLPTPSARLWRSKTFARRRADRRASRRGARCSASTTRARRRVHPRVVRFGAFGRVHDARQSRDSRQGRVGPSRCCE
jgi:hypothetical protein